MGDADNADDKAGAKVDVKSAPAAKEAVPPAPAPVPAPDSAAPPHPLPVAPVRRAVRPPPSADRTGYVRRKF